MPASPIPWDGFRQRYEQGVLTGLADGAFGKVQALFILIESRATSRSTQRIEVVVDFETASRNTQDAERSDNQALPNSSEGAFPRRSISAGPTKT